MSNKELEGRAASRRAPIVNSQGGASPLNGAQIVYRSATSTSNTTFTVPGAFRGKYLSLLFYSGSVVNGSFEGPYGQVAFSAGPGPAPNLVLNQTVAFSATGSMQSGMTCLNGVREEFYLPFALQSIANNVTSSVCTTMMDVVSGSFIASSTGGYFEISVSDLA